jgi:hypothetical protein
MSSDDEVVSWTSAEERRERERTHTEPTETFERPWENVRVGPTPAAPPAPD